MMFKNQNRFGDEFKTIWAYRVSVAAILVFAAVFGVRADRIERLIDKWSPTYFDVSLVFNDDLSEISRATTKIGILVRKNNVELIDLDFGAMPIQEVLVNEKPARYVQHDQKLDVYLPKSVNQGQRLQISVTYSGKPADGLTLTKDKDGTPSAIGDNWPDRVHAWIPCLDHPSAKAPVKFTVTAPAIYSVVANGKLVSRTSNGAAPRFWVFDEKNPISPYNMVVAVGQFATGVIGKTGTVPLSYYVTKSDSKLAPKGFSSARDAVSLFSRLVQPYPYQKLALIVGATQFGGMENANTIVFAPNLLSSCAAATERSRRYGIPQSIEDVVAHEIAHQWFGDSVTESTWADLWLSEGFATYFAGLFLENREGKAAFQAYMRTKAASYLAYEKRRRAPIHDKTTEKLFDLLNPNNYEKGGWVLHEIRGLIGDPAFFAGLRLYYARHKGGTATTDDLRAAFEKTSRKDLRDFFDRWVYRSGHPIYRIGFTEVNKRSIEIRLFQLQQDEAFLTPLTLEIVTSSGKRRVKVVPTGKESVFRVPSVNTKNIVLDPDEFILKEIVD